MQQKIDGISLSVTHISAHRKYPDGTTTGNSTMTGFLWRRDGRVFLVTNHHNVSGINPETGEHIGTFVPTHLIVSYYFGQSGSDPGTNLIQRNKMEIELYDTNDSPIWITHSNEKDVDIVLIELQLSLVDGMFPFFLNEVDFTNSFQPQIGEECFIVGYPENFAGQYYSPIWKRGSVATLPLLDHDSKPVFLLDTIGNSGLSGSPVIARGSGIHNPGGGPDICDETVMGTFDNFVGIYAGRMSNQGIGSQLGRVWKSAVISEILENA